MAQIPIIEGETQLRDHLVRYHKLQGYPGEVALDGMPGLDAVRCSPASSWCGRSLQ